MNTFTDFLLSRNSHKGNYSSFVILSLRFFCGLMMLPFGYGKIVNYDQYVENFFEDPIGIGNIPSLWLTIFAQIACPILLLLGFQTRIFASILAFNMLVAFKYHFTDPFNVKALPVLFLGLYVFQLLTGAGKYSLDYLFYEKNKVRCDRDETKGMILFFIACGIACPVLGNCFSDLVSVCLIASMVLLYLACLHFIRKSQA